MERSRSLCGSISGEPLRGPHASQDKSRSSCRHSGAPDWRCLAPGPARYAAGQRLPPPPPAGSVGGLEPQSQTQWRVEGTPQLLALLGVHTTLQHRVLELDRPRWLVSLLRSAQRCSPRQQRFRLSSARPQPLHPICLHLHQTQQSFRLGFPPAQDDVVVMGFADYLNIFLEDLSFVHQVLVAEFLGRGWLDAPAPLSAGGPFAPLPEAVSVTAGSTEPQPAAAESTGHQLAAAVSTEP
ncbi:hypothetical protein XENOCAPTIV_010671 [Xenoophorus captivus]|uniref:Uncharacterized protein n=1 Tax=Xenoophorus captivus TaxID=1517983 RepID=A0ABV0S2N1_9TELE